jgi:SAM-dependent methyltransferase
MSAEHRHIGQSIVEACELELAKHGDNYRGAGYTRSAAEAQIQYGMILGVIRERGVPVTLLDLGCGLGHLNDFLRGTPHHEQVRYTGLDMSARYIEEARQRSPQTQFVRMDLLESERELPQYDYIVMNGLFNYRGSTTREGMKEYWQTMLGIAWRHCTNGMAFNVMSKIVDWERDDLFHVSFDELSEVVARNFSRHFIMRHDYGAYEYTTFVYREPCGAHG